MGFNRRLREYFMHWNLASMKATLTTIYIKMIFFSLTHAENQTNWMKFNLELVSRPASRRIFSANRRYHFDNWRIKSIELWIKSEWQEKERWAEDRSDMKRARDRQNKIDSLVLAILLNTWRMDCCTQLHNRSKDACRHNAENECKVIHSIFRSMGRNVKMVTSVWRIIFCNINPNLKSLSQKLQNGLSISSFSFSGYFVPIFRCLNVAQNALIRLNLALSNANRFLGENPKTDADWKCTYLSRSLSFACCLVYWFWPKCLYRLNICNETQRP